MRAKKRVHVTLPGVVLDALEALARLNDQSLSDLMEDLGRAELQARGIGPKITAKDIEAEIARRKRTR